MSTTSVKSVHSSGEGNKSILTNVTRKTIADTPKLADLRRARDDDLELIMKLATPDTYSYFGDMLIADKLHRSYITLVMENDNEEVVSAICLDDHPNIPSIHPSAWYSWMRNLYQIKNVTLKNSKWIHYIVHDTRYTYVFMKPLLQAVFKYFSHLVHLLVVAPPTIPVLSFIEGYFTRVIPVGARACFCNVQSIYVAFRHHYAKEFKIRRAVVEDNDDLVEIIDGCSKKLKEMYGEFYISEILTQHPDVNRQLIVAEFNQQAIAVICMNEDVNYEQLGNSFELETFNYLRKYPPQRRMDMGEEDLFTPNMSSKGFSTTSTASMNTFDEISSPEISLEESLTLSQIDTSYWTEEDTSSTTTSVSSSSVLTISDTAIETLGLDIPGIISPMKPDLQEPTEKRESDFSVNTRSFLLPMEIRGLRLNKLTQSTQEIKSILTTGSARVVPRPKVPEHVFKYHKESRPEPGTAKYQQMFVEGDKNAFTLELLAAEEEHEEEVLVDLLESCFQCFPNYDYCVMTVPAFNTHSPFMNHFVRAVPQSRSTYPHELYLLHKNAIKPDLIVREARTRDRSQIEELINALETQEMVRKQALQHVYNPRSKYQTYVMLNYSVIVAFAVLQEEIDFDYIYYRSHLKKLLKPEVHRYDKIGILLHAVYSPIFQNHGDFFLTELHRLSDYSIILYKLKSSDMSYTHRQRPLAGLLPYFLLARIAQCPNYPRNAELFPVPDSCYREDPNYSLYVSTPKLCSLKREEVNSRILVVGASSTGLAFLEQLFFGFNGVKVANFNNVTLVHHDWIYYKNTRFDDKYAMFVYRGDYTLKYMYAMSLKTHANFVRGFMTEINRKNKYITIDDKTIVPYDVLILTCGEQYHLPVSGINWRMPTEAVPEKSDVPYNVFIINKVQDAEKACMKLVKLIYGKKHYQIIVYGTSLHAYCCLATLQRIGIPCTNIIFVEPYPIQNVWPSMTCFNHPELDELIQTTLEYSNIEVFRTYYFLNWEYKEGSNLIESVRFQNIANDITEIECIAMFYYDQKTVDFRTFQAINNAGLVYDGRLVIDPVCMTNDPHIYAAGPMTKYSRRYYAENEIHKYYNAVEIGKRLARHLRAKLLPGGWDKNPGDTLFLEVSTKFNLLVPRFKKPMIRHCNLPGGFQYLHISAPGKILPLQTQQAMLDYGRIIYTGNLTNVDFNEDPRYFAIQINTRHTVKAITCLTKRKIDLYNIIHIWGKHEKLLNNLIARYELGMISDFYSYFQQPVFFALYNNQYDIFRDNVSAMLHCLTEIPGESLIEDLEAMVEENGLKRINPEQERYILERFLNSGFHEEIINMVLDYLGDNIRYLPMFAHYLVTKFIVLEKERSPLFRTDLLKRSISDPDMA